MSTENIRDKVLYYMHSRYNKPHDLPGSPLLYKSLRCDAEVKLFGCCAHSELHHSWGNQSLAYPLAKHSHMNGLYNLSPASKIIFIVLECKPIYLLLYAVH